MSNDYVMVNVAQSRELLNRARVPGKTYLYCLKSDDIERLLAAAPAPPDTANVPEPAAILKLRGKMSQRAESQEFNEWDARAAVEHVDALRAEVERLRAELKLIREIDSITTDFGINREFRIESAKEVAMNRHNVKLSRRPYIQQILDEAFALAGITPTDEGSSRE